ncbi:cyclic nucleotide-binding domain-containing protein [Phormidium sp. FACHB-1136]|jgi:CRP/FNR family cyclic AMP-dependent transcriptional regulator|uniref:cyclic nucleotide-binding domain-containing protein n=1 Tax=Phormidium sp. FACHB-1136 TaxID=2692848 RepID=UPI001686FD5D|nr:cyclic nucleotide-binding domain-containing protein [Phormidium sp. FACHB-1136]MBD2426736.1 cyclic nucleotide-binding domain-containing protein [Phormidium sp. FACHB-1136]
MLNPAHAISLFTKAPDIHLFKAGETIFEIGTTGQVMYGVIEGEVDMMVNGKVFETIQAGDVFGEGALVQDPPLRASTAVAKTDCKLAAMDKTHFKFLVQETPLFALEVIRSMSTRLRAAKAHLS